MIDFHNAPAQVAILQHTDSGEACGALYLYVEGVGVQVLGLLATALRSAMDDWLDEGKLAARIVHTFTFGAEQSIERFSLHTTPRGDPWWTLTIDARRLRISLDGGEWSFADFLVETPPSAIDLLSLRAVCLN